MHSRHLRHSLFCFVFCLFSLSLFSQDLIVTKGGESISCKILSIDSLKIIYRLRNESPRHEIQRLEVENYYLSTVTEKELDWINKPLVEFFSLGFNGGLAYPIGDFASMDASSELSGMAYRGYVFTGEAIFKLSKYVGLSASYFSQRHGFNYQNVENYYNSFYTNYYSNYFNTYVPINSFRAEGGDWLINGLFFGLHADFPLKYYKGLSVFGNVSLGVPKFTFPEQIISRYPDTQNADTIWVKLAQTTARSGAIRMGLGLRYELNKYIAFQLSGSFFSAKPSFFDILITSNRGPEEFITYEQKMQSLNVQAGISFLFYRKM